MTTEEEEIEKRLANPELLTDRDLNIPMHYLMRHNESPDIAKYEMSKWSDNPNDKTIDIVVDEAARRLGLGSHECLSEKRSGYNSGMIEMATHQMTKMGLSPNRTKESLMRWTHKSNEEYTSAAVDEAARRLGLKPDEVLHKKKTNDSL